MPAPALPFSVLVLSKRAAGQDLAGFHARALAQAQDRASPPGCGTHGHFQAAAAAYRQGEPVFDAIDDYRFGDAAAARAWQREAAASHAGSGALVFAARATAIVDGAVANGGFLHVELLVRRDGARPHTFLAHWHDTHGPIASAMPAVRRYHQLAPLDENGPATPFDGIAMLWFDSMEALRENARHPAFAQAREDLPRFADMARSKSLLTQYRAPSPHGARATT